jgi:hypothetical protein
VLHVSDANYWRTRAEEHFLPRNPEFGYLLYFRSAFSFGMFKRYTGCWADLRKQLTPAPLEVDYHHDLNEPDGLAFYERMAETYKGALEILKQAHKDGVTYVMFRHGSSTPRRGATTHRSQIRRLMRSKEATPYVIRKECIQHRSVFVAAIRSKT